MAFAIIEEGRGEVEALSSRFIAYLYPLNDPEEFASLYQKVKKLSPKADHYPYAYLFGGVSKTSDDGEPSGAAGRPILSLLESRGITRAALIVARYFGGSKLGLPRLRKTFVSAAEEAINDADLGEIRLTHRYGLELSYHDYEEVKRLAKIHGGQLVDEIYDAKVRANLLLDDRIAPTLLRALSPESEVKDLGEYEMIKEIEK